MKKKVCGIEKSCNFAALKHFVADVLWVKPYVFLKVLFSE